MKRFSAVIAALLVFAFTAFGCATMSSDSGWITLIDGGKGLENFNRIGDANWRAEGGAIVADKGKGGHLVTKNSYRNFQIRAEFWAEPARTAASSSALPIPARSAPPMPMK